MAPIAWQQGRRLVLLVHAERGRWLGVLLVHGEGGRRLVLLVHAERGRWLGVLLIHGEGGRRLRLLVGHGRGFAAERQEGSRQEMHQRSVNKKKQTRVFIGIPKSNRLHQPWEDFLGFLNLSDCTGRGDKPAV